ncbi:MAG TPA: hypothetical protein VK771_08195 [Acidimicrobiia bacterium]|nr:hypothetical protein [Acidimicrobiia bacterium]
MDNLSTSLAASFERVGWAAVLAAVQSGCSVEEAHALLRAAAAASDTTVEKLADDVVHGRFIFNAP